LLSSAAANGGGITISRWIVAAMTLSTGMPHRPRDAFLPRSRDAKKAHIHPFRLLDDGSGLRA